MEASSRAIGGIVVALASLCCAFAAGAAPARADGCDNTTSPLYDSGSFRWDLVTSAAVSDGGYDPEQNSIVDTNDRRDAFDHFSRALFAPEPSGPTPEEYSNPDAAGCSSTLGGRELVYPADTTTVPGLSIVRKVYVPATGTAFMRVLDEVTNTTPDSVAFSYQWGDPGNLGSDANTVVLATSSGDTSVTADDGWVATAESDTVAAAGDALACDRTSVAACDPPVATVWDETAPDATALARANEAAATGASASDTVAVAYPEFILFGNATIDFMHVVAQRLTTADAVSAAGSLGAGPSEVFAGMSDADCTALINWVCRKPRPGPAQQTTPPSQQTPQSPSVTQPAAFGGIALGSHTLKVNNGKVTVTVSCPTAAVGNCVGTDTLSTAGKVVVAATAKHKKKVVKLGKGTFSIAPGKKGRVTIKLNKTARKLLARKRTLKAKQKIVAHDSRNVNKTTVGNLKLKSPRKKH